MSFVGSTCGIATKQMDNMHESFVLPQEFVLPAVVHQKLQFQRIIQRNEHRTKATTNPTYIFFIQSKIEIIELVLAFLLKVTETLTLKPTHTQNTFNLRPSKTN